MKKLGFILISIALLCVSCETKIKDIKIKHLQPIKIEVKSVYTTSMEVNVTADRDNRDRHGIHSSEIPVPSFDSVYLAVSTSPDMTSPTIYRAKAIIQEIYMKDNNTITFLVTDLSSDVTYYLQAYVIPPYSKPIYSEIISHVKEKIEFKAIDLGLSVKWANMNVGATSPEGFGDYFAWGETSPKSVYDWSTYKYCNGSSSTMTKYCENSSNGTVDNKTTLELADDAAHVNMGGNWRMPTKAEQDELRKKCTWKWTRDYVGTGVSGYIVSSNKNSNSIFLPAAGYCGGSSLTRVGTYGYYLSSSLYDYFSVYVYDILFGGDDVTSYYCYRYSGYSVRPVCP